MGLYILCPIGARSCVVQTALQIGHLPRSVTVSLHSLHTATYKRQQKTTRLSTTTRPTIISLPVIGVYCCRSRHGHTVLPVSEKTVWIHAVTFIYLWKPTIHHHFWSEAGVGVHERFIYKHGYHVVCCTIEAHTADATAVHPTQTHDPRYLRITGRAKECCNK